MDYRTFLYEYLTTIIGAFTFFFNFLELIYIKFSRCSDRNPIGMVYIFNMSLSDLFVGLVMVILKSMHPYMSTSLAGNMAAEEIYHVIRFCFLRFSLLVSVFNLIALTLDRVFAIRFPYRHQRQRKIVPIRICIFIWILSFFLTAVFYCVARFRWRDSERYKDLIFPIATFPATLLFICSYSIIFTVVKRTSGITASNRPSIPNGERSNSQQHLDEKKNFMRLAFKTVAIFVICWIPLSCMSLFKLADGYNAGKYIELESSFFTFAFSNSLINSFIYFAHFRKMLQKTIRKVFQSQQSHQSEHNLEFSQKSVSS